MKKNKINRYLSLVCIFSFLVIGVVAFMPVVSYAQPEFSWHGQFRINSYTDFRSDTSTFGQGDKSGNRLRWRPTIDVKMSDTVKLHTQFNIGHIESNQMNARYDAGDDPSVALRHAVIQADLFDTGITAMAGLVPFSDKFGDTLFSGDWDWNPLALIFTGKTGDFSWRAGLSKLQENTDGAANDDDDLDFYIFDVDHEPTGIGLSAYWLRGGENRTGLSTIAGKNVDVINYGGRYSGEFNGIKVNAFVIGSHYETEDYFASGNDLEADGVAGKLEVKIPVGKMTLGIMGTVSSGDSESRVDGAGTSNAFITPMSIAGHTGYWGYTGKLNEQGPTDTKIDDHMVNLDGGQPWGIGNLGYGLWTIQGNVSIPINKILSAYLGVGYYETVDAPTGQDSAIGTDFYAQGKLNLGQNLNLEFGVDYLNAQEGHYNNIAANQSRDITTLFSRLQLEY